ncbi:MAG TPA: hypothetical protein VF677_13165 [Flavobacterium sp.]|jgi:hypothetical protein
MKTKYIHGFVLLLFIASCATIQKTDKSRTLRFSSNSYIIKLPYKTYKEKIIRIGISEMEYQYVFNDSSKIYCTDQESSSPLIHRFLSSKDYISFLDKDTLLLSFFENDKYYCVRKLGKIFIGYSDVKKQNKQIFDNAINTLQQK